MDCDLTSNEKNLKEMGQALFSLLKEASIVRLVFVDDSIKSDIGIEELYALALSNPERLINIIPGIDNAEPGENDMIRQLVDKALEDDLDLMTKVSSLIPQDSVDDEDNISYGILQKLHKAFPPSHDVQFLGLNAQSWENEKSEILDDDMSRSLVLFDRDFSGEGRGVNDGLQKIQSISNFDKIYCALLTHTVNIGDELEAWSDLSESHNLDKHKFVVISKKRLTDETNSLAGFLHLIRLAILSRPLQSLRASVLQHFKSSIENARKNLDKWTVFDLTEAVFRSSVSEGVWEGDTLLRIMSNVMMDSVKDLIRSDNNIHSAINFAQAASDVRIPDFDPIKWIRAGEMALSYQRSELYHDGKNINEFHLPLEVGDIFENTKDNKKYILLGQPCDLMIRPITGRTYDPKFSKMVPLCSLKDDLSKGRSDYSYELKYYYSDGSSCFVHFSDIHLLRLSILDLCVLNKCGRAIYLQGDQLPVSLHKAWREHGIKLVKQMCKDFEHVSELSKYFNTSNNKIPKPIKAKTIAKILPCCSNTGTFKAELIEGGFSVNLMRVARVNQKVATDILRSFTRYQSRTGFEQDVYTSELRKAQRMSAD